MKNLLALTLLLFASESHGLEFFRGVLPSVALTDHLGRPVDIGRELLPPTGGVVLSFSFGGCKTFCPATELEMQILDAELAPDWRILTLTLDPHADTVERLATHARERGASSRWRFLTGDRELVYALLDRLDIRFGSLDEHPPALFLGVDGKLYRLPGQPDAREVIAILKRLKS